MIRSGLLRRVRRKLKEAHVRRRYPDFYDDELQAQRLRNLGRQYAGSSISIVGNAQSIFKSKSGHRIDQGDVVIRINRGFITQPECQGTRTDIVSLATSIDMAQFQHQFRGASIIFVSPWRWSMSSTMMKAHNSLACYPLDRWKVLSRSLFDARPSAGLITIDLVRTFFAAELTTLFGFDWKASPTFYARNPDRAGHHDWEAEKSLVRSWLDEGWLRLDDNR